MTKIFVVDDDPAILQLISEYLKKETYEVTSFADGNSLVKRVREESPDCLVLDIMLPGIDGLTLLTELRSFTEIPIIMVSARGEEIDRIIGLELGCNDFLSKPFNPRELVGRVKSMLRLSKAGNSQTKHPVGEQEERKVRAGDLEISPEFRRTTVRGTEMILTSREFELLTFLSSHPERPFSREQLIQQVWNYDFFGEVRVVDDLVKRIRKKLAEHESSFTIQTVWGFGYKATVRTECAQ
ncbi:response regulator transcription factor [Paenibacillus zanthoxyli]|uniref:response regulator transcription factor n=1 Tax=Paenibacillus zanthoxyli TaxID=369399 RepID=UPI000472B9D1|nr:response regulator transcription factor [Paenibacillus zanthoxyli]